MNFWKFLATLLLKIAFVQWYSGATIGLSRLLSIIVVSLVLEKDVRNYLYVVYKTLPRDANGVRILFNVKRTSGKFIKENGTIAKEFQKLVAKHPNRIVFICNEKRWTYKEVEQYSNRIANLFHSNGYRKGDVVALFMESSVDFVSMWLGLSKIGVISAMINFNLRNESLVHNIGIADAKAVIFTSDLADAIKEVRPQLAKGLELFFTGQNEVKFPSKSLEALLPNASNSSPPKVDVGCRDKLCYIYTSGTTGMPKAAPMTNLRYYLVACMARYTFGLTTDDRIYVTLPLYHSSGLCIGLSQALTTGNSVVIRHKFSASQFWDDCIKYDCTAIGYIGEMCRYLLAQPPSAKDRAHKIRLAYGNGLRKKIWTEFVDRFNIGKIAELYAATEGNANVVNLDNTVGAVGFMSRIAPFIYPLALVKVDNDTGEPLRNEKGFCIKCQPEESGQMVGIVSDTDPIRNFDGYVNKAENAKKTIHNVFKKGDRGFLSGDVLKMDNLGYLYFMDRIGDTYRWKGENVATAEVEATVSNILNKIDCVAYGVSIPGTEGKAGMLVIVDSDDNLDLLKLTEGMQKSLPAYARPLFLRTLDEISLTGTFKIKKVDFQREGFDPSKCKGSKLFFWNGTQYIPLTDDVYKDICNGKFRF